MDINQLEFFKTVAELEHVSKAANTLFISQPALTKRIRALENQFGTTFFDHVGKKIILNNNGKIFLKYANQMLNAYHAAQTALSEEVAREDYIVRISCEAGGLFLPELIRSYREANPHVEFRLTQYDQWVNSNITPDLIFRSFLQPDFSSPNMLTFLKEEIMLAVPEFHPLASKDSVTIQDFYEEPIIGLSHKCLLGTFIQYYFKQFGYQARFGMETYTPVSLSDLLSMGLGVAFLPTVTWRSAYTPHMKLLHIADFPFYRYMSISWPEHIKRSYASRQFLSYVLDSISNLSLP